MYYAIIFCYKIKLFKLLIWINSHKTLSVNLENQINNKKKNSLFKQFFHLLFIHILWFFPFFSSLNIFFKNNLCCFLEKITIIKSIIKVKRKNNHILICSWIHKKHIHLISKQHVNMTSAYKQTNTYTHTHKHFSLFHLINTFLSVMIIMFCY